MIIPKNTHIITVILFGSLQVKGIALVAVQERSTRDAVGRASTTAGFESGALPITIAIGGDNGAAMRTIVILALAVVAGGSQADNGQNGEGDLGNGYHFGDLAGDCRWKACVTNEDM